MTGPTPEMEAAYRQVAEAVDALDPADLEHRVTVLLFTLEAGPDEVIHGAGTSLVDLWFRADQIWANDSSATSEQRRELIGYAIDALDRQFPHAAIRTVMAQASAASQEAQRLRLEQLLTTSPEGAARQSLDLVARFGEGMGHALGEVVVRSLLIEGARLERLAETPPAELASALRLALGRPGWLPQGVTRADLAVIVATLDYLRDDHSRLDAMLDMAEGGPFGDSSSEGYLAVLRASAAIGRLDVAEAERLLRLAAGAVTASGNPSLITAYRGICDLVARTRHQRIGDPLVELAQLKPDATDRAWNGDAALILDAHEMLSRHRITEAFRARLATWRATDGVHSSVENRAMLWGLCALVAIMDGHASDAQMFAERSREARAQLVGDGMQAAIIDHVLLTFEGARALRRGDPHHVAASLAARLEELGPDSDSVLATITEAQQSIMHCEAGEYREALRSGVRALASGRRLSTALPGSSERTALMETTDPVRGTVLKAAARVGDARLMAEVLEFLRAQDLPIARRSPTTAQLPLANAVPPATGEQVFLRPANPLIDAIELTQPTAVLMPWGSVALVAILGEQNGVPALVRVPR